MTKDALLDGESDPSTTAIGERLGVSRFAAPRLRRRALAKLKEQLADLDWR